MRKLLLIVVALLVVTSYSIPDAKAETTTTTNSSVCTALTRTLFWSLTDRTTGGEVSMLQKFLASRPEARFSLPDSSSLGFFGSLTRSALMRFQQFNGISSIGIVGPLTRTKIKDLSCGVVSGNQLKVSVGSPIYCVTTPCGPVGLGGVRVTLSGGNQTSSLTTDSSGIVRFGNLILGTTYSVTVEKEGYQTITRTIPITGKENLMEVTLTRVAYSNKSVTLSASPTNGQAPLAVTFSAALRNLSSCRSTNLNFGDGSAYAVSATCTPGSDDVLYATVTYDHTYTASGTYTATLSVNGVVSEPVTITVDSSYIPNPTVITPNGGESWSTGTNQTIKWKDNTQPSNCTLGTYMYCPAQPISKYDIKITRHYECTYGSACPAVVPQPQTVAKGVFGTSYSWSAGKVLDTTTPLADGQYVITVCNVIHGGCDSSDSYFKILNSVPVGVPQVTSPNTAETWIRGTEKTVAWSGSTGPFDITLVPSTIYCVTTPCSQPAPLSIAKVVSGNRYVWNVGRTLDGQASDGLYYVKVCVSGTLMCDQSDYFLTINSSPVATLLGDVNGDGVVSLIDVTQLQQYLAGTGTNIVAANSNLDTNTVVDLADFNLLRKVVSGVIGSSDLPLRWGDVNRDGSVSVADAVLALNIAAGSPGDVTAKGKVAADADMSGGVTSSDATLINAAAVGLITLPAVWGDVTGSYTVDLSDLTLLSRFVDGLQTPTAQQRFVGDVYNDNTLNAEDVNTLRQFVLGTITTLPVTPATFSVLSPNGGERRYYWEPLTIAWSPASPGIARIDLLDEYGNFQKTIYSQGLLGNLVPNINGSFTYYPTVSDVGYHKIRVYEYNASTYSVSNETTGRSDTSDSTFSLWGV